LAEDGLDVEGEEVFGGLDGAWGFGGGEGEVFEVFLDGLEGLGWEEFAVFVEEFEGVPAGGVVGGGEEESACGAEGGNS
jgi:hypothetical protein